MERASTNGRRVAVIGLDGTPFSFLQKEIAAGTLPNLEKLLSGARMMQMETEIPTISSVAWASFMTGKNPGEHGIFGFTDREPSSYEIFFPNYAYLKAQPIWNRLSDEGRRCCVMNVPSTYPARPLNGVLVSGFVAPSLERATYPIEAYEYLAGMGYRIDTDASKARQSLDLLIEDLHLTLEKRREAMLHFWNQEAWDLFMCVFTGTDRLHHFMWRRYEEGDPVYGPEFIRFYQRVDEIVGEFHSMLPPDTSFFMLSDHGFCSIRKEVYLNSYLKRDELIAFQTEEPRTLADIDPARTLAYCLDPGRIYLNLQGREPAGIVSPGETEALKAQISSSLMEIRDPDTGEAVIDRIVRREDLFTGPLASRGPDLVAMPRRGYDLKGTVARPDLMGETALEGMHTHDDAFLVEEERFAARHEQGIHIREVAADILAAAGTGD